MTLRYNGSPINATIDLPGSKSISNRLLILKEVLTAKTEILNLSQSKDTHDLIIAIDTIKNSNNNIIDVGPAGTSMRFLTAFLASKKGEWIISGSERMKERPIKPLVEGLRQLGADISYKEKEGFPPLHIKGKSLRGGTIEIDGSISSQFITALLLSAPLLETDLRIVLKNEMVSWPYIKMTIALLEEFGVNTSVEQNSISVFKRTDKTPILSFSVEADWSSASYWFSIAALSKNSEIRLRGLREKSLQGDSVLLSFYEKLGVKGTFSGDELILKNTGSCVSNFIHDFSGCPDIAQTVAVTCLGLNIPCRLTGLSTLKHKETDRISALKTELEKFDAIVSATENSFEFTPGKFSQGTPIAIETYKDHRMAMSFAPLALKYSSIEIKDPCVVQKSYPEFWEHLRVARVSISE